MKHNSETQSPARPWLYNLVVMLLNRYEVCMPARIVDCLNGILTILA